MQARGRDADTGAAQEAGLRSRHDRHGQAPVTRAAIPDLRLGVRHEQGLKPPTTGQHSPLRTNEVRMPVPGLGLEIFPKAGIRVA
jgi:hypothetical protein